MAIEIVDLPSYKMVIPNSYVKLPEGNHWDDWLVVYLPLWEIWVRQLGSFFPIYGKK